METSESHEYGYVSLMFDETNDDVTEPFLACYCNCGCDCYVER